MVKILSDEYPFLDAVILQVKQAFGIDCETRKGSHHVELDCCTYADADRL
ncbi:hypothetical protein [Thermoflavimicrobium daqui]|nr:hypothetical protein [Thermoflavimicrobium daqui]